MAAAELGVLHRGCAVPGGKGCPGLGTDAGIVTSFTPVPPLRMGLEVHAVISPVCSDLQSRVGQSLTSLAELSAEETWQCLGPFTQGYLSTHSLSSPLQFRVLGTAQQICSSEASVWSLPEHWNPQVVIVKPSLPKEIRCRVFYMQCLISVPDPTVVLSRWNPVMMESILDVIPRFLCSC